MFKKGFLISLVFLALLVLAVVVVLLLMNNQPLPQEDENQIITGQISYQCADGYTAQAVFMTQGPDPVSIPGQPPTSNALVSLSLDGAPSVLLPQTISADGSRYATKDESLVFWSKGSGAMILESGVEDKYQNCIIVKDDPGNLSKVYLDEANQFTLRYPSDYVVDDSYTYDLIGPSRSISGVKFSIPASLATDTNLSNDTYISFEHLAIPNCTPDNFVSSEQAINVIKIDDENFSYLMASTTDAGAGNRYEEYVYAIDGASPCLAIRYFIHYSVFENYPEGAVTQFDKSALLAQFDAIKKSLTINAQFAAPLLLNADVYPLYPDLNWQSEEVSEYGDIKGYVVTSEPQANISDISSITQPFETYYADILISKGWEEDISMAAGGPGSAIIAYKKDSDYVVLQYKSEFGVNNENEPAQCPCSVTASIFSGSN
jgi:membrane-bound inhibitor of C-type lysozyme